MLAEVDIVLVRAAYGVPRARVIGARTPKTFEINKPSVMFVWFLCVLWFEGHHANAPWNLRATEWRSTRCGVLLGLFHAPSRFNMRVFLYTL